MEKINAKARELNDRGVEFAKERRLAEAADYFRQATQADDRFAMAFRNLGNALMELGDVAAAAASYERVLELEPNSIETLNNLGTLRSKQKDYPRAIELLARATQLDPNYFGAFNNLGIALASASQDQLSLGPFRRAIALKPDYAEAHSNLGLALIHLGRPDEAVACCERALALRPAYADAHTNLAMALTELKRLDESLEQYQRALDLDPAGGDQVRMNRATTLFLKGDYEAGWQEYEFRLKKRENIRVTHEAPRWDGAPLAGRTLLLEAEQGMGDTIQFARLAAEIKRQHSGKIILSVEARLLPLLAGLAGVDQLVAQTESRPAFDVWLPLLSLPGLLKINPQAAPANVPYLQADSERVLRWQSRLAQMRGVKVGVAWQGNKQNRSDFRRSFSLAELAPLGKLHGLTLISLQKGDGAEQLETLADFDVVSLGPDFDASGGAFLDAAAVMKNLDLVITADTSTAHLAGALGVPVWLPLAYVPDWRWGLSGERTSWYPTMRLFRQQQLRNWPGVFEQMAATLLAEFPQLRRKTPAEYCLATSGFNRLARTRHGPLVYNRHDIYIGKSLAELGEFSEGESELFRQCVQPGALVVEAGANIGAHTVALAKLAGPTGFVHAIEPQRIVFQTLCANVALNSLTNVHCHQAAVGAEPGSIIVPAINFNQPANFGGVGLGQWREGERVPVITIDSLNLARCNFLKLDVEGMELPAIRGAEQTIRRCRPILYVENDRQEHSAALIEAILALGYKLYWHLPAYYQAENYYANRQNSFGNLLSINMLGVHQSVVTDIQGLREITTPASDWRGGR